MGGPFVGPDVLQMPEEVGVLDGQAGVLLGQAAVGDGVHRQAAAAGVGAHHVGVRRVDAVQEGDAVAARDVAGHEAGLGQGAGAVVHAGVGHVHGHQLADHGLELEHRLQGALADLRLVGGVGGVELRAADDVADDAGDEVAVGAGAQEACHAVAGDLVAGGQFGHLPHQLLLREGRGQVQPLDAQVGRDIGEEVVGAGGADDVQHGAAVLVGVGDVGMGAGGLPPRRAGGGHASSRSM